MILFLFIIINGLKKAYGNIEKDGNPGDVNSFCCLVFISYNDDGSD